VKPPRDHVRLIRAFDIPPTKFGTAVWTTGVLGLFGLASPIMFVPAGAIVAGVGGMSFTDRRAIAKGLREVEVFGFPVEGYRGWLLADMPAFDIELRRDVDVEVVRTSTIAIDPSIVCEKKSPRVFRFVMRRVGLPNTKPHLPAIEVGDRRLLKELHRRILAPLHADVGIVRMVMGDNAVLAPIVAQFRNDDEAPVSDVLGLGAFRESAMAAPPALQALVHVGGERALPHEARRLRLRSERVMHAANSSPSGFGTVAAITVGGLTTGGQFGVTGVWFGMAGGFIAGVFTVISGNRQNARSVARAVSNQGYPIEDYDDWLLSGRPLMDIETERPMNRQWFLETVCRLTAWSVTKGTMVSWVEDVTWFSDTEVRLETRPSYIQPPTSRIEPFYGGSHDMFRQFMGEVLSVVHRQYGIRVVKMGGYVDRRI
jgi:hypothetical protein